ncbi:MAG TPA: IPTL-CTERM sorting domain-containing protein, partial [Thermoanaerobaculaceae bacterium]|nr:IPTL-CTERM sorting domain-containing protein [Thermoanaerobaculaceae bacterium]
MEIKVLLDLDGSPSTGCNIVTPAGTFAGADQVLIATVDTASNRVTTLQRQVCSGGTLGAPVDVAGPFTPPWPIGPGNGAFGSALVESYFPLSLAGFVAPTIPVGFVVSDAGGDEDALLPAGALPTDGAATRIPALSSWGVLLLSALILFAGFALLRRRRGAVAALGVVLLVTGLAGVAWAAITLDGQASDWAGIDPLATKPPSAHPTHPELLAVYGVVQDGNMFFRADATLCSTIGITPTTLVNATVGTAYPDTTFTASGGSGSYTWSETGALPANMTFSAGGELSGTPTASGSFTFTVTAVDANGCSGSQQVTLDVCVTPSVSIVASATTICAGTPVTFTATPVEGGAAPSYQWRVNGGNVGTDSPSFASSTLADGDQVDVVMTSNASPCTSVNPVGSNVIAMTVHANPATPSITPVPAQVCAGSTGNQASGPAGAASYAWSISGGTITSATNIQTITYTAGASGTVGLTLTVSNASGCTASNTANVTINANPATPSITPVPAQ